MHGAETSGQVDADEAAAELVSAAAALVEVTVVVPLIVVVVVEVEVTWTVVVEVLVDSTVVEPLPAATQRTLPGKMAHVDDKLGLRA